MEEEVLEKYNVEEAKKDAYEDVVSRLNCGSSKKEKKDQPRTWGRRLLG